MIHFIHRANRHLYKTQLESMHRQRRDHFISERGWALTERDGGEYDEYDDEHAAYLVALAPDDDVAVSVRFRPTAETSLIADVFPHLVAPTEQPMKGADMYEATRYCAAKPFRGERGFMHRSKLHVAMIEVMRDAHAKRLFGFMDLEFIPYFRRFSGLKLRPIGMPAPYDQGITLAFEIGVSGEDLDFARSALRIGGRQLFEAPSWLPKDADPIALARATEILVNAEPQLRRDMAETVRRTSEQVQVQDDITSVIAELSKRVS